MIQSITRHKIAHDVETVEAMVKRLVPYVYESELYGLMPDNLPRLTVGGLLMLLYRLSIIADQLSFEQRKQLQVAQNQFNQVRLEWSVAVEGKIQREFRARLDAMNQLLSEYNENATTDLDDYPVMAEKRIILEALKDFAPIHNHVAFEMHKMLVTLDQQLRQYTRPSDFLLDSYLERAYPNDQFWFLYAKANIN
jgi:hypothetical protein